jgi:glucose-1-phosphate cytidylyltransferase
MTMQDISAIILAGGKGERLRPFTESIPKALVPLNGVPLLRHLMTYLAARGVTRFVLCTGYLAEKIDEFARTECDPSWTVTCVNSGDATMTDRILDALEHVKTQRALICYGDTLANVDMAGLVAEHGKSGAAATLTVYPLHSPFGIVSFEPSGQVREFLEKPLLPYWINIGFLLCEPQAFAALKRGSDMVPFLTGLAQAKSLHVYRHEGKHLTVNTEKERAEAESNIEFFTLSEGGAS